MRIVPIALASALLIALASPVSAQGTSAPGMFVGGLVGVTFGTATSSAIAGQVGVRIMPNVFVIGEIGRIQDVLPAEAADLLDEVEQELEDEGISSDFSAKVPAFYGFGGLRWAPSGRRVAPFVEGGAGFAHLTANFSGTVAGIDISEFIEDELGSLDSINEFLIAFGGGVNIGLTPTVSVDAGYRFTRIFTDEEPPNTSMIYGAIKIMFGR